MIVVLARQPAQARGGARAEHFDPVTAQPANHVEVDIELHSAAWHGRMIEPVDRAEQPLLFAVPQGKQNRTRRWRVDPLERSRKLQYARHAAGVIVGAVMNMSDGPVAILGRAVSD